MNIFTSRYRRIRYLIASIGLVCLTLVGAGLPAHAEVSGFELEPFKLEVDVVSGTRYQLDIILTNHEHENIELTSDVVDFSPSEEEDGIPHFLEDDEEYAYGLKDWVTPPPPVKLGPGEEKKITLDVEVPVGATIGGHYGAVLFGRETDGGGQAVSNKPYIGCLLLLTVDGVNREQGRIVEFSSEKIWYQDGSVDFSIRFQNTGTVHLKPRGVIQLFDMMGNQIDEIPVNDALSNVLPHETRLFTATWSIPQEGDAPYANMVEAKLEMRYVADGIRMYSKTRFLILPLVYPIITGVGIVVAVAGFLMIRRATQKKNRVRTKQHRHVPPVVPKDDDQEPPKPTSLPFINP